MACCPALAAVSGEITQVRLEPQDKRIAITSKGKVGKHLARVIGRPNRLVMDFEDMTVGKVPPKITGDKDAIHEIRVSNYKSSARVVVDFQSHPVPTFQIRRGENQVFVIFGNALAASGAEIQAAPEGPNSKKTSLAAPLAPEFVTRRGQSPGKREESSRFDFGKDPDRRSERIVEQSAGESKAKHPAVKEVKLAQSTDLE